MDQQIMQDDVIDVPRMQLNSVIGFNGSVVGGLKVHPDRQHIVYPLGCAVVIEDITKNEPCLLWGHTDYVTCIAISNNKGELIASGQKTYMGFKALTIVWDYQSQRMLYQLDLHKVNIQALVFSPNDLYLASLGGCDDGSVVIWDMNNGEAICGSQAQVESAGNTKCIAFSKCRDDMFVTGGDNTLRVWELSVEDRKIRAQDVDMGQIKRVITCIEMDSQGREFFFCGTTTGDILAINMKTKRFQYKAPEKTLFSNGVTSLSHLKNDNFLVGTGCGKLYELVFGLPECGKKKAPKPKEVRCWADDTVRSKTDVAITSITLRGTGHQFFVGTANGRMYKFSYECKTGGAKFDACELIKTCHSSKVNDIVFPEESSDIMLTCQREQIRIWAFDPKKKDVKEVKRHTIPNMTCNALALACQGQAIISAWDDGIIRVFGFDSKKNNDIVERKKISAAHSKGVTAIACTKNHGYDGCWNFNIISGGGEGQVRIWRFSYDGRNDPSYSLDHTLKEHKGSVSDIKIRKNDTECVSASTDGTAIVWNLEKCCRSQIVFANTLFKCVGYSRDENQILTSGTDRKIGYWECFDGSLIRELEGAKTGAVNAMDISTDGECFVTGGDDKLLKVWTYNEGEVVAVGTGHSATITRIKISPNKKYITSVSEDGAILIWKFPF